MKNKSWIKSPWTISIGTAICSFVLTVVYDYSKDKPILSTVGYLVKTIWNFIKSILNFELKIWWILVAILAFIGIVYLIDKLKDDESFKPDFCNYKEGVFKHWRWTWGWVWNTHKNTWTISDLKAHCPRCNTPMIDQSSRYMLGFDCPRCDYRASDVDECDIPHKIERIILDNIDREREKKRNESPQRTSN